MAEIDYNNLTDDEIDARISELESRASQGGPVNTGAPETQRPIEDMTDDEIDARLAELESRAGGGFANNQVSEEPKHDDYGFMERQNDQITAEGGRDTYTGQALIEGATPLTRAMRQGKERDEDRELGAWLSDGEDNTLRVALNKHGLERDPSLEGYKAKETGGFWEGFSDDMSRTLAQLPLGAGWLFRKAREADNPQKYATDHLMQSAFLSGFSRADIEQAKEFSQGDPAKMYDFFAERAEGRLKGFAAKKQGAQEKLAAHQDDQGFLEKVGGGTLGMAPMLMEFALGGAAGKVLTGATKLGAIARAAGTGTWKGRLVNGLVHGVGTTTALGPEMVRRGVGELTADEYGVDEDGNLLKRKGDDTATALKKAIPGRLSEVALFSMPFGEAALGWATPAITKALRTKVGQTAAKFYENYVKYGQMTGLRGQPQMLALMDLNAFKDEVLGWGVKDADYEGREAAWQKFKDETLSIKGQTDLFVGALGVMLAQGSVAGANAWRQGRAQKLSNDRRLRAAFNIPQEQLDKMEPELKRMLVRVGDNLYNSRDAFGRSKVRAEQNGGKNAKGDKYGTIRDADGNVISEGTFKDRLRRWCDKVGERLGKANGEVFDEAGKYALEFDNSYNWEKDAYPGQYASRFKVPSRSVRDKDGKLTGYDVAWEDVNVPLGGDKTIHGQQFTDPNTGISVLKYIQTDAKGGDNGYIYLITDENGHRATRFGQADAMDAAKAMDAVNQRNVDMRDMKAQMADKIRASMPALEGTDMFYAKDGAEFDAVLSDVNGESVETGSGVRGVTLPNGRVMLCLDRIENPQQMKDTMLHEAGRHLGLDLALPEVSDKMGFVAGLAKSGDPVVQNQLNRIVEARMAKGELERPEDIFKRDKDGNYLHANALEEVYAHLFDRSDVPEEAGWWDAHMNAMRRNIRKVFKGLSYSRSEAEEMYRGAMEKLRDQTGFSFYEPETPQTPPTPPPSGERAEQLQREVAERRAEGRAADFAAAERELGEQMGDVHEQANANAQAREAKEASMRGMQEREARKAAEEEWERSEAERKAREAKEEQDAAEEAEIQNLIDAEERETDMAKREEYQKRRREITERRARERAIAKEKAEAEAIRAAEERQKEAAEREEQRRAGYDAADRQARIDRKAGIKQAFREDDARKGEEYDRAEEERKRREAEEGAALPKITIAEEPHGKERTAPQNDALRVNYGPNGNQIIARRVTDESGKVIGWDVNAVGNDGTETYIASTTKPKKDGLAAIRAVRRQIHDHFGLPYGKEARDAMGAERRRLEEAERTGDRKDEARTMRDEAPAQPEQGTERTGEPKTRTVAGTEKGAEPSKTDGSAQNLTEDAAKPVLKAKRNPADNFKGYTYDDYGAPPNTDEITAKTNPGGTGDVIGSALLSHRKESKRLFYIPESKDDPLWDWYQKFNDVNARKNRRGDFIALFGMNPKKGRNDAFGDDLPPELWSLRDKGAEAVAEAMLKARKDYAEWVAKKRNGQREAKAERAEGDAAFNDEAAERAAAADLSLESMTPEQAKAEEVKLAEQKRKAEEMEEIERRKSAPLKGGGEDIRQGKLDIGGAEGEDTLWDAASGELIDTRTGEILFFDSAEEARDADHDRDRDRSYRDWLAKYRLADSEKHRKEWERKNPVQKEAAPEERTRITPAEDAAYMDAVRRGDTETAERMKQEAVSRAMPSTKVVDENGRPLKVYHGSRTGANIKIFNTPSFFSSDRDTADMFKKEADFILKVNGKEVAIDDITARQIADELTRGDYTPNEMADWSSFEELIGDIKDNGKGYGGRDVVSDALAGVGINTPLDEITEMSFKRVPDIYECYVNITNPLEIDFKGRTWGQDGTREMEAAVRDAAKNGYDGVIVRNIREGGLLGELRNGEEPPPSTDYIPISPNQIKSADPVTYDDAGNVIPLSQRFNRQNNDIRFFNIDEELSPREEMERERRGIGGIYTGTAADYANRSREGGKDDGPSLKKIGTGEGSQVYGWGLYGSTVRGVAEEYARADRDRKRGRRTTLKSDVLYDGKPVRDDDSLREKYLKVIAELEDYGSVDKVLKNYEFFENHGKLTDNEKENYEWLKANRDRISMREVGDAPRHLYEQTFFTDRAEGDESHLLKWYEPVTDKRLLKEINEELPKHGYATLDEANQSGEPYTGGEIYNTLAEALGSPKAASEWLAAHDIDGVKYPVDSYGGKTLKDGDAAGWNYVAFSDEHIRVDHKWTDGQMRYFNIDEEAGRRVHAKDLDEARRMEGAGAGRREIWEKTGWWKAKDGKWRYEIAGISDADTKRMLDFALASGKFYDRDRANVYSFTLNDLEAAMREKGERLPDSVKTLLAAYPKLGKETIEVDRMAAQPMDGTLGYATKGKIHLYERGTTAETLNHELQHRIQAASGMAGGTNTDGKSFGRYTQEHGEWEARQAATRAGMDADERGRTAPWETADRHGVAEDMTQIDDANRARIRPDGEPEEQQPAAAFMEDNGDGLKDKAKRLAQKYMTEVVDKLNPIRQMEIGAGKRKSEDLFVENSPYNVQRLLPGKQEAAKKRYEDIYKKPFMKMLSESGATVEDVGMYMIAMNARDRNRKTLEKYGVLDGAGLSDADADKLLSDLRNHLGREKMGRVEKMADLLWKMQKEGMARRVESGRVSKAVAEQWEKEEPHHVPMRDDLSDENGEYNRSTRRWTRNDLPTARGRHDMADNPVEFMFMEYQDAMYGANSNEARRKLADFVRSTPGIGKISRGIRFGRNGLPDPNWREQTVKGGAGRPNLVSFKENGELYTIELNGKLGEQVAEAVTGRGVRQAWKPYQSVMRAYSSTATELSPAFGGRNFMADMLEASLNTIADKGLIKGGAAAVKNAVNAVRAMPTITHWLRTGEYKGAFADALRRYVESGSLIGGMGNEGFSEIKGEAEKASLGKKSAADMVRLVMRPIELYNKTIELGTRLAVFKDYLDGGASEGEAAMRSREYSTDFNKYGNQRWLNSLFMFSGSVVGGAVRQTASLVRGKTGIQLATGLFTYGMLEALAERFFNEDDDEKAKKSGQPSGDTMTEYQRANSLYFRVGGKFIRINFHAGPFSVIKYAGNLLARAAFGDMKPGEAWKNLLKEAGSVGMHFTGTGDFNWDAKVQSLTPTLLVPFLQAKSNEDFAGKPIRKQMYSETKPFSENGRKDTGETWKLIARGVNAMSGGNEKRRGLFDYSPEMYKHWFDALGKNLTRDISSVVDLVTDIKDGKSIGDVMKENSRHVLFAGDVVRNIPDNTHNFYDAKNRYQTERADGTIKQGSRRDEAVKKLLREIDTLRHWEAGEEKKGGKWVPMRKAPSESAKEKNKKMRLKYQQQVINLMNR